MVPIYSSASYLYLYNNFWEIQSNAPHFTLNYATISWIRKQKRIKNKFQKVRLSLKKLLVTECNYSCAIRTVPRLSPNKHPAHFMTTTDADINKPYIKRAYFIENARCEGRYKTNLRLELSQSHEKEGLLCRA